MKSKPSGAAYRKRRRQRELENAQRLAGGAALKPLSPELLPAVKEEDLDTVAGNRREMSRIYALARAGRLASEVATRLAYILQQNAGLCRIEAELREVAAIREQLMRLNGAPSAQLLAPVSTNQDPALLGPDETSHPNRELPQE